MNSNSALVLLQLQNLFLTLINVVGAGASVQAYTSSCKWYFMWEKTRVHRENVHDDHRTSSYILQVEDH